MSDYRDPETGNKYHELDPSIDLHSILEAPEGACLEILFSEKGLSPPEPVPAVPAFPRFLNLPWELRHHIWHEALRLRRRGAQFFTLHAEPHNQDGQTVLVKGGHANLSAPSKASWFINNTSEYTIDMGLWTACRESRKIITKYYARATAAAQRSKNPCRYRPVTGIFMADRTLSCFTTYPLSDLFVLRIPNLESFTWDHMKWVWPLMDKHERGRTRNFALEYDPRWLKQILGCKWNQDFGPWEGSFLTDEGRGWQAWERPSPGGTLARLFTVFLDSWSRGCTYKLWLIDHDMKPRGTLKDSLWKDAAKFHANGKKFVEVYGFEASWASTAPTPWERWASARRFLTFLQYEAVFEWHRYTREEYVLPFPDWDKLKNWQVWGWEPTHVGILACVDENEEDGILSEEEDDMDVNEDEDAGQDEGTLLEYVDDETRVAEGIHPNCTPQGYCYRCQPLYGYPWQHRY